MSSPTEPAAPWFGLRGRGALARAEQGFPEKANYCSLLVPGLQWDPPLALRPLGLPGELWGWRELGCPPGAAPAPPSRAAGTDPPCQLGRWFANLSRDMWESSSSSSSQEEGQAQSEVPSCGLQRRAVLLCDLHRPLPVPARPGALSPLRSGRGEPLSSPQGFCFWPSDPVPD